MMYFIFLAILNGVLIGISRSINGRLSIHLDPFRASYWNHLGGFIFLSMIAGILLFKDSSQFEITSDIPLYTYLGGFFGTLFVAVNSYVFPRLGAFKTVLLVISGQMISSLVLDYKSGMLISTIGQFVGVAIILFGIFWSKLSNIRYDYSL
jgi:transporter family-2 protein